MGRRMVIGVDFGGSSSKATLLDESGAVVATATREYPSYYPQPGWVEQDPDDYYRAFLGNVRELMEDHGVRGDEIAAIALDAATHMAVLLDEDGKPVRNMIHWSDRRSGSQAEELKREAGELIRQHCCNTLGAAWTLPQLIWLREHEPEALRRTKRICFAKDYVRSRITGDFCTDHIEAMGALLADDRTEQWQADLCALAGLRVEQLPEIRRPQELAGTVNAETAAACGLTAGTPVLVGTTDTVLEVYASGVIAENSATVKLATAGRICPITRGPIPSHQFFNYKHLVPGLWYPGTGTRSCAASYTWYRNVFGDGEQLRAKELGKSAYQMLNDAAEQVDCGCGGLFFHPYLLGEMTPYYDDRLRASFTGVAMHHTKGHFSRAVMEGVAYSMKDCALEIEKAGVPLGDCRLIGGGAKGRLWRQIMADVLNRPLIYTESNDSSLGAAMLAGTVMGLFSDYEDSIAKCVRITEVVQPDPEHIPVYEKGFRIYRAMQQALAEVYHQYEA